MFKKILCLGVSFVMLVAVSLLTACPGKQMPTELHVWQTNSYETETGIIYEVKSMPAEISGTTLLWDIDNVQLDLSFGWNTEYRDHFLNYDRPDLVCFAAYFYWTVDVDVRQNNYNHTDFDDYKNPPDAFFLGEIVSDEFLSEKYEVTYGASSGWFSTYPPVFNELHKPLQITIPQEVYLKSEEKGEERSGSFLFRFGVVPVYYSQEKNTYSFGSAGFGIENDGLRFLYGYKFGKISIVVRVGGFAP